MELVLDGKMLWLTEMMACAGGPVRGNKQPDWLCRDCGNKNFGWREVCNRCQVICMTSGRACCVRHCSLGVM